MIIITTRDYGYKAYLKLKYDAIIVNDKTVKIDTDKTELELFKEYSISDFPLYNEILKKLVKG